MSGDISAACWHRYSLLALPDSFVCVSLGFVLKAASRSIILVMGRFRCVLFSEVEADLRSISLCIIALTPEPLREYTSQVWSLVAPY